MVAVAAGVIYPVSGPRFRPSVVQRLGELGEDTAAIASAFSGVS